MDIQTKDGILLRNIPDGTPDDVIKARIEKIRAEGQAQSAQEPVQPKEQSTMQSIGETAANAGKGFLSGTADIGNTLINLSQKLPAIKVANKLGEFVHGVNAEEVNNQRQEGLKQFNEQNSDSTAFNVGRIGGNIAGTAGVGGAAGTALGLASKTPRALALAEALKAGGMGAGTLTNKLIGGAAQSALGGALIEPSKENIGTSAALGAAFPLAGAAIPKIGGLIADALGVTTGTGGEAIKTAARSGMQGGKIAKALTDNMRGKVAMTDVLDSAKQNIQKMGAAKSAAYRSGMIDIANDKTVLNFDGIDDSIKNVFNDVGYKGKIVNESAYNKLKEVDSVIDDWKASGPTNYEFHTPEGMDKLKQKVGAILENIPYEQSSARRAVGDVYHSIKNEISKQAPTYAKTMKEYSESTELIREIEKSLSLGNKASVDTGIRKLQSLTRNNVNTNYGNRLELAHALEQQGGNEILPALSGQALSSITPRGLQGAVAAGTGAGGLLNPTLLAALPMQSPRLVGEAAFKTGQAAKGVKKLGQGLSRTSAAIAAALQR